MIGTSTGIEPYYFWSYYRKSRLGMHEEKVDVVAEWQAANPEQPLPDYFVTAMNLEPADHVRMQAAVQKYIDSSISKTINCPEDISFGDFKDVYMQAYDSGCKGCTTYRPNDVTGSVLEVKPEPQAEATEPLLPLNDPMPRPADEYDAGGVVYMTKPLDRPEGIPGKTYKIKWPENDHAF